MHGVYFFYMGPKYGGFLWRFAIPALLTAPAQKQDVCLVAVQQNGRALRHASEQQQNNKEVVDAALENCTQAGGVRAGNVLISYRLILKRAHR